MRKLLVVSILILGSMLIFIPTTASAHLLADDTPTPTITQTPALPPLQWDGAMNYGDVIALNIAACIIIVIALWLIVALIHTFMLKRRKS